MTTTIYGYDMQFSYSSIYCIYECVYVHENPERSVLVEPFQQDFQRNVKQEKKKKSVCIADFQSHNKRASTFEELTFIFEN